MTPEKQRIAIAEFCGWRNIHKEDGTLLEGAFKGMLVGSFGNKEYLQAIPNYPNDLNAMHEAEKKLSPALIDKSNTSFEWARYVMELGKITGKGSNIHASSQQRSEALCRTLWPERFS